MKEWMRNYRCAYCYTVGGRIRAPRAVIRVVAGTSGGGWPAGGYPACADHQHRAITDALDTLGQPNNAKGWKVSAYRVTADEYDDPDMRHLWTARARP